MELDKPSGATLPATEYSAVVNINSEDAVPTASVENGTDSEDTGTMTLTLRLSGPGQYDIINPSNEDSDSVYGRGFHRGRQHQGAPPNR